MDIYLRGVIGEAWQYNGDVESMPDWARHSSRHHLEVKGNGTVYYYCVGYVSIVLNKGDWLVTIRGDIPEVYSDDAFKRYFTLSDPARSETKEFFEEKEVK